jgi:membrane protease YdiL (CAAX protease family)
MSRRDLRKCYSRFSISVLLMIVLTTALAAGLSFCIPLLCPSLIADDFWRPILDVAINDVSVYLPGLIVFPLLLGKLPRANPIPVDRLSFWEFLQAAVFCLGVGYLCSILSSVGIMGLEWLLGLPSENIVTEFETSLPLWLTIVSFAVIAPILEEVIFRKLLLNGLRGLGDVSAVVLSALAFALFHMNLYQTAYAFVLGMVFGAIVLLTGSIRDTIFLHMLINGLSVVLTADVPELVLLVISLGIYILIGTAIAMFITMGKNYHMEPGPLPFHSRDKRRACFCSVWFWLLLVLGIAASVLTIFYP